jgi:hypothetical protein
MQDARGSYNSTINNDAMLVRRANYFQQRCPYDTVLKRIPGSTQRGGMASLQHAQMESSKDTWPVTIPMNSVPSMDSLGHATSSESIGSVGTADMQLRSRSTLAYPSANWTVRLDKAGRQYYVNKIDKRISWTFPNEQDQKSSGSPQQPKDSEETYIEELEDRILQRFSSDSLVVGEGSKKDYPDPLRDALLNKRARREERGVMLENAHGDTVMALVEGGRDGNLSGAAPIGVGHPGIHQSISRGLSGSTRILRNLSKAKLVTHTREMGTYSLLRHGSRAKQDTKEDVQVEVLDSRPNTAIHGLTTSGNNALQDQVRARGKNVQETEARTRTSPAPPVRKNTSCDMETLGGLPTFNPADYRTVPPEQTLAEVNSRAVILNYPSADLRKSTKGVLAPVLDRVELPDPHFVKTRVPKNRSNAEWARPITALTPKGIVYNDGTMGPSNPLNHNFDQQAYEDDLKLVQSLQQDLMPDKDGHLVEGYRKKFREWVRDIADRLKHAPAPVIKATQMTLPLMPINFKDQLEIIQAMHEQKAMSSDLSKRLKSLVLTDNSRRSIPHPASSVMSIGETDVRKKGGVWPDSGGRLLREASSTDTVPFAEFRCESPVEEYTTTLKSFDDTVSNGDAQVLRDVRPAGRTTPGGHAGGEAFGNVSESVQNLEEAITRRTTSPVTSVYLPRRRSEVTICHYAGFHGHEKDEEAGLLDPNNRHRLQVTAKVPKVLGVDSVFYDSSNFTASLRVPKKSEVEDRLMDPFSKSNWMTMTTQRLKMGKGEIPAQYLRTPGRNVH